MSNIFLYNKLQDILALTTRLKDSLGHTPEITKLAGSCLRLSSMLKTKIGEDALREYQENPERFEDE